MKDQTPLVTHNNQNRANQVTSVGRPQTKGLKWKNIEKNLSSIKKNQAYLNE